MSGSVEKETLPMILAMSKLRGCPDRHVATQTLACSIPAVGDSPIMCECGAPTTGKKWCTCWALELTNMAFLAFQSLSLSGRRLEISFSCFTWSSEKINYPQWLEWVLKDEKSGYLCQLLLGTACGLKRCSSVVRRCWHGLWMSSAMRRW